MNAVSSSSALQGPVQRLAALRQAMQKQGIDAWIIPSADPHLSEYLPEHWQGRRWVSGFTGSVGTLVVTAATADLWADSRYWEQATAQLAGTGIQLQKLGRGRTHVEALAEALGQGAVVGVAPDMLSRAAKRQLEQAFVAKGIQLRADTDLLAGIWTERPALPAEPVVVHAAEFVSETAAEKLARVRAAMQEKGAAHHLISSLDDIAWLTNLRGNDVSYNPVFLAHLLIGASSATLYVDDSRLTEPAREALAAAGISVAPYEKAADDIARLADSLLVDPAKVAASTLQSLKGTVPVIESVNPSTLFKSVKSPADVTHTREAMIEDGVALCHFFVDFEARLARGEVLNELDIDRMLLEFRSQRPNFVSLRHDCRLQRQRRAAPLFGHARGVQRDPRRRPSADRFRGPVPERHHRHHPRGAGGNAQRRAQARQHAGAEGTHRAGRDDLPGRHCRSALGCHLPQAHVAAAVRLRPRNRPWRGLLHERA